MIHSIYHIFNPHLPPVAVSYQCVPRRGRYTTSWGLGMQFVRHHLPRHYRPLAAYKRPGRFLQGLQGLGLMNMICCFFLDRSLCLFDYFYSSSSFQNYFICFVVINPRVLPANKVDFGFFFVPITPPPPPQYSSELPRRLIALAAITWTFCLLVSSLSITALFVGLEEVLEHTCWP